jgi:hypothetical protein
MQRQGGRRAAKRSAGGLGAFACRWWVRIGRRSTPAKPYQGLPDVDYPLHDRDILVTACGRICMHKKKINLSAVLAGQRLGLKEVDDAIWLVSFMTYDLGYIDLEQRTLQPLDNPFGTRLLPIS